MLTISGISKSYGPRTLFEEVSLQVNREDRIGLVGPNGAGKTTLLSIILGQNSPDTGTVTFERGITVGYLPQESAPAGEETVLDLATAITPEMEKLQRLMRAFEAQEAGVTDPALESVIAGEDYHTVQDRYIELGGYQLEPKAKQILHGLSFRESDFNRPARELSGGWVMRAHLGKLLVQEPDLLVLDEPTNHLDLESLQWFQEYLKGYPGAILLISHDREFLNQLCTHIIDIRLGRLTRYRGTYEDYLVQRAANEERQLAAFKNQQKDIARLQEFADRFRAKASKASQAQSKLKQIERMEKIEAPEAEDKKIHFQFPQPQRSGLKVITIENINHAYGTNVIYRGMDFVAERGQKTVLVGPNGAGKSTLLKILAGVLPVQSGTRTLGHNAKSGYFSQYRVEVLNAANTVLEEAMDTPQRVTEQFIRTVLGSFLFRGDDVFKRVNVLSGGEKSRLALVKLLLDPPNLLLMDEPTTHLDMASIDALVGALKQFDGTLIFISHDVYFIKQLANHVVHVNAGKLTHYAGDYQYYLDRTAATSARAALTSTGIKSAPKPVKQDAKPSGDRKEQKRTEADQRQARARLLKEQQQRVHKLEKEISDLEKRRGDLTIELEKPETYSAPGQAMTINRELSGIEDSLHTLGKEWEKASTHLLELEESA